MPSNLRVLIFAVFGLMMLVRLDAGLSHLKSDEVDDCLGSDAERSIRGCSLIIESKLFRGKPITRRLLAHAYYNRGYAYDDKGDLDRAIADYDLAVELSPNYPAAFNNRGLAYQRKGDLDRAYADYQHALELDPDHADAYGNRGLVHEARGEHKKAIADFRKLLELRPGLQPALDALKRLGAEPAADQ